MSPDQDPNILKALLDWAWAGCLALVGIVWKANGAAIEKAHKTAEDALSKASFKEYENRSQIYFEEYVKRAEQSRIELRESIVALFKVQAEQGATLARIEGKLDK